MTEHAEVSQNLSAHHRMVMFTTTITPILNLPFPLTLIGYRLLVFTIFVLFVVTVSEVVLVDLKY